MSEHNLMHVFEELLRYEKIIKDFLLTFQKTKRLDFSQRKDSMHETKRSKNT